jgi:LysM repeat protein
MRRLIFAFLCATTVASAKVALYTAKNGDSVESVAAEYYGNRSLGPFLMEANGLKDAKLKTGQKVRIPTAFSYRVRKGDTLEALAQKFLDDKRRAPFLAAFSGVGRADKIREGQELIIPFQHVHVAPAPESLQSVARSFYGDSGRARMLADYNFRTAPMLAKGERLLLPITHIRIRSVRLDPKLKESAAAAPKAPVPTAPSNEAQKREEELAARVTQQLALVETKYKEGSYQDVPSALDKMLTEEDPSEAQLAEIFRWKAFAYVALGLDELAVQAFREVLARKPDEKLDEATVSPKIRAAFEKAQKAPPATSE